MAIFWLSATKGSYFFNGHYSSHSVFPIIFWSFICEIHPNFVPCFVSPLSCHCCMPCLHLIILCPLHLGLDLSPSSIQEFHPCCTSNPTANDMQIALPLPANATRACHLNSHDSNVIQEAHPTYIAAWVCCQQIPLAFVFVQPPTDQLTDSNLANKLPFCPCSFAICTFPALLLSLTFTDCITSCWHLEYCCLHTPWPLPNTHSTHIWARSDHVWALCSIGLCHPVQSLLYQHSSHHHPHYVHLMAAQQQWQQYQWWCGSSGGEDSIGYHVTHWWKGQHPTCALGAACGYSGGACQVGGVGHTVCSYQHCLSMHNFDTNTTSQWHWCQHHILMISMPHPDDTNTTPQRHHHHIPMTPTSHPDNTDIASQWHQYCLLTTPTLLLPLL